MNPFVFDNGVILNTAYIVAVFPPEVLTAEYDGNGRVVVDGLAHGQPLSRDEHRRLVAQLRQQGHSRVPGSQA